MSIRTKHVVFFLAVFLLALSPIGLGASRKAFDRETERAPAVARTSFSHHIIVFEPVVDYESLSLRVSGPQGLVFEGAFDAGLPVVYDLIDRNGNYLQDATYTWEMVATPKLDPSVREALAQARAAGDDEMTNRLRSEGKLPSERLAQSGAFTIVDGRLADPDLPEAPPVRDESSGYSLGAVAPADVVVNDDKIITGSLCVGFDCVNGEVFGFDTARLKENNLRLHFQDTSNSASFPTRDWRWVANDSTNGGSSYMGLEDIDNSGRITFRVFSGASNNALVVDAQGDVGLSTQNPVTELHIVDGDSPTLRLEQDGSSGFAPQSWDVAGNETNFFIRDVTNGSLLPFRIRPSAPTSSIDVANNGNVGFGTTSPDSAIHVVRSSGAVQVNLERTGAPASEWVFNNSASNTFDISRVGTGGAEFSIRADGQVTMGPGGAANFVLSPTGNLTIAGNLTAAMKPFKIDHPLDPANKFLYHTAVESSDMMNIYNGNVQLDENGEAWVQMPEWFEALNMNFRYQLTAVGGPAPNLHVVQEISDNRFKIAGGPAEGRVSWQVTGVRHDAYAKAYPMPVEEDKSESLRGTYLHPELFAKPPKAETQKAEAGSQTAPSKVDRKLN